MRRRLKITEPALKSSNKVLPASGIILAGGKNSRMGRNKAFLEYQGRPVIERTLEVLRAVFPEVIISSNEPELYAAYNIRVIPDLDSGKGPLAGLRMGLQAMSEDTGFFVACDMPFLQPGPIRYLWQWVKGFDIVVPRGNFGFHPLHAYYNRRCLPYIEARLKEAHYKIIDVYPQCNVKYVDEEDLRQFGDVRRILANINTPDEWDNVIRHQHS